MLFSKSWSWVLQISSMSALSHHFSGEIIWSAQHSPFLIVLARGHASMKAAYPRPHLQPMEWGKTDNIMLDNVIMKVKLQIWLWQWKHLNMQEESMHSSQSLYRQSCWWLQSTLDSSSLAWVYVESQTLGIQLTLDSANGESRWCWIHPMVIPTETESIQWWIQLTLDWSGLPRVCVDEKCLGNPNATGSAMYPESADGDAGKSNSHLDLPSLPWAWVKCVNTTDTGSIQSIRTDLLSATVPLGNKSSIDLTSTQSTQDLRLPGVRV